MLVLSRKKNESIVINDDIKIVVVEIRGDKVRLGVEAPKRCRFIGAKCTTRSSVRSSSKTGRQRPRNRNRVISRIFREFQPFSLRSW